MMKKSSILSVGTLVFSLGMATSLGGCLQTRSQIRGDSADDASRPVKAAPVQEVQPQGGYVLDEVKNEITRLSGRVEDLERQLKEQENDKVPGSEVDPQLIKKLEARIDHLEKNQQSLQESVDHAKTAAAEASKDPNHLFLEGKKLYEDQDYETAAQKLAVYLKTSKPKKAEEATFIRAESLFHLKDYKKAIVEYSKFSEKYTHSSYCPEALYKTGLSFEGLGLKEDAKGFYQELVEKFPKSSQAKKIRKKVR